MDVEKERLSGNFLMPNWVAMEHHARFRFVSAYTKGKVVVDCACGNGEGTNVFSEGSASTHGFDVSQEAIDEANQKCKNPVTRFTLASGTQLPLDNNFADVYVSLETIEHIEEDEAFLKEVSRVLKTGGMFICSTPNRNVTNPGKKITDKPANIFHVREYSEQEFTALLKRYFSQVELYGQNRNQRWKVRVLAGLGRFLPFHLAVRLHQIYKLLAHFLRPVSYYNLEKCDKDIIHEYVTAVCIK
ncbi:MAG: class I SAM-dependent methyltransferase [Bacteroidetes bacterium]|nr:class I SAM-dependent methyltransferase [Bacteroidota bacterium]